MKTFCVFTAIFTIGFCAGACDSVLVYIAMSILFIVIGLFFDVKKTDWLE